jgi:hypothetical protein
MKPIQFFLLAFALLALVKVVQKYRARAIQTMQFLAWVLISLGATFVAVFPDTTNFFAAMLGIWRGADLLLYASLVIISYLIFRIHLTLDRVQQEITEIVRVLALDQLEAGGSAAVGTRGGKET